MDGEMYHRTRSFRTSALLIGTLAVLWAADGAAESRRWEVTVAARIEGGTRK